MNRTDICSTVLREAAENLVQVVEGTLDDGRHVVFVGIEFESGEAGVWEGCENYGQAKRARAVLIDCAAEWLEKLWEAVEVAKAAGGSNG